MVSTAAVLIGTKGVAATSFSEVLAASGAPRGSIYHYFPGGKKQLIADAVRWTSGQVLAYQRTSPVATPEQVLLHFLNFFRGSIVASDCEVGCPVAAIVIGAYVERRELSPAVGRSFRSWHRLLTEQLTATGVPRVRAHPLATIALASIEGALVLCRAQHSVEPLDAVAGELRRLSKGTRSRGS